MSRDPCRRRDGFHRPRFSPLFKFHFTLHSGLKTLQFCPVSASKGWPVFQPPYLHSIHASAITCLSEVCSLHPELLARLETHSPGPPSGSYVLPSQVILSVFFSVSVFCSVFFLCFFSLRILCPPFPGDSFPFSLFFLHPTFSQRPWPIDGGEANPPAAVPPSLILTGAFKPLLLK